MKKGQAKKEETRKTEKQLKEGWRVRRKRRRGEREMDG